MPSSYVSGLSTPFKISAILVTLATVWLLAIYAGPLVAVLQPETAEPIVLYEPRLPVIQHKVAVIIEDRPLNTLVPLLLHFAIVLGPSWPLFLYTSAEQASSLSNSTSLNKWTGQIGIRILPENTTFDKHDKVSRFLTESWLWQDLAPAKEVLLFQADSIICANSQFTVDDFLGYDFVGAPIAAIYGEGYNGGLSLRNRQRTMDIIGAHDWTEEKNQHNSKFEDQWFFTKMKEIPDIRLPAVDVAGQFAVETIYYSRPLGYHQVQRWQPDRMAEIEEWCPEVKLTIGHAF